MQELVIDRVEKKIPKAGGNPFYVIHGEGGEEMTSFDGAFEGFGKGTRLNIELKIKGKHTNIENYEVLSATTASEKPNGGSSYKKDIEGLKVEYQLKARLQAIERASIEAQTAYNGAISLINSGKVNEANQELVDSAITWGIVHLMTTDIKEQLARMPDIGAKPKPKAPDIEQAETPSEGRGEPAPETGIDMDWLKENLSKARWTEKTAASWCVFKFKVEGGLLKDVLTRLTKEQREEFVGEIEDRLEMK